jgi:putative ABC transport system permease protein
MLVDLKDGVSTGERAGIIDVVNEDKRVSEYMLMKEQSVDTGKDRIEKTADLIVPENTEKLKRFIILRDRISGKDVPLADDGVVITEKLAKILQAHAGDNIYIKNGDDKQVKVKVNGITENYVSHYIYMPPGLYEKIYKEKVKYQIITAKTTDVSEEFEDKLSTNMLKNSGAASVRFTTGISSHFKDIIGSLNYIVLVLIISAGLLAFVVLYNLTNINISERYREIATIKVLGFYDNEVSSYVYRENMILTLLGMLLGLFLGIFLHQFIVVTAEVDYVMFGRSIEPLSYLYSTILTVCFSALVNFVMYFRLRKIKMVESLKSVD